MEIVESEERLASVVTMARKYLPNVVARNEPILALEQPSDDPLEQIAIDLGAKELG